MKLSIPYGFRFEDPDLTRIMAVLHRFHPVVQERAYVATRDFLARHCANAIDKAVLKGRALAAPFDEACAHLMTRQERVRVDNVSDPQVDHSFEVIILPFDGGAYGIVTTEQKALAEEFLAQPGIMEFRYWSGSAEDRPSDVPDLEWAGRGETWATLIGRNPARRISSQGIVHRFPESLDFPSVEEVASAVPSFEDRLRRYAKEGVVEAHAARLHGQGIEPMAAVMRAIDWQVSEAGQVETFKERERLRERLRSVLGVSDLVGIGDYAEPAFGA